MVAALCLPLLSRHAMLRAGGPPGVLRQRQDVHRVELSLTALGQRSTELTEWSMVLPWQGVGSGMARVVQRMAEGREPWADWRGKWHWLVAGGGGEGGGAEGGWRAEGGRGGG